MLCFRCNCSLRRSLLYGTFHRRQEVADNRERNGYENLQHMRKQKGNRYEGGIWYEKILSLQSEESLEAAAIIWGSLWQRNWEFLL